MRIASLGSGSKGNATLVDTGETLILIDCGLPRRAVEERLSDRGVSPDDIDAILVTHEHGDHCRGCGDAGGGLRPARFSDRGHGCEPETGGSAARLCDQAR